MTMANTASLKNTTRSKLNEDCPIPGRDREILILRAGGLNRGRRQSGRGRCHLAADDTLTERGGPHNPWIQGEVP
jgi:hypothetical protein